MGRKHREKPMSFQGKRYRFREGFYVLGRWLGFSWLGKQGRKLISANTPLWMKARLSIIALHAGETEPKFLLVGWFVFRSYAVAYVQLIRDRQYNQQNCPREQPDGHPHTGWKEKTAPSKRCSQIPLAAHGLSHSLCDKPQGGEYNALSVLCIPHTQGSGSVSAETDSFSVTNLSLKSNVRGTCKTSFISKLSFLTHWNKQNGVGQLAVTTFQDCFQASRGAGN